MAPAPSLTSSSLRSLRSPRSFALASLLALAGPALGCSDEATHTASIVGDTAIGAGLPASSFVDNWTVQFDQFVVVVQHPALIEQTEAKPAWIRFLGVSVWDLAAPLEGGTSSFEIDSLVVRASSYDGFDFRIAPPSRSGYPTESGNVDDATLEAMIEDDVAIRVVGSATDGVQTISFDWSFSTDTLYRCGVEVELGAGEVGSSVIEIHGDRLFANQLGDASPTLEFAAIAAADADGDGVVTLTELDAVDLASIGYDANGEDVTDLGAFVRALSRSLGTIIDSSGCEVIEPIVEG